MLVANDLSLHLNACSQKRHGILVAALRFECACKATHGGRGSRMLIVKHSHVFITYIPKMFSEIEPVLAPECWCQVSLAGECRGALLQASPLFLSTPADAVSQPSCAVPDNLGLDQEDPKP